MTHHLDAAQEWAAYLDAVESAARDLERRVLDPAVGPDAVLASLSAPPPRPGAPWPAELEPRRQEVLTALAVATATVERHRDHAAAALAALGRRPARPLSTSYTDGGTLDVLG